MSIFGPPNVQKMLADKNIEGLIKALGHSDQAIRHQAVLALAQIGDPRAIGPLAGALFYRGGTSTLHRQDVAEALASFGEPGVRPLIGGIPKILSSGDRQLIAAYRTALSVIGWTPGGHGIVEAYTQALSSGDPGVSDLIAEVLRSVEAMEKQRAEVARLNEEKRRQRESEQRRAQEANKCGDHHLLEAKCGVCKRCGKTIHDFSNKCVCRACGYKAHNFGEGVYRGFFHRCTRCGAEMHVHS